MAWQPGQQKDRIPRPGWYKGILFRSMLEVDFARALDRVNIEWVYEPKTFFADGQFWRADFLVSGTYIELKPSDLLPVEIAGQIRRISCAWETEPGAVICLIVWRFGEGAVLVFTGRDGAWVFSTGYPAGVIRGPGP